MSQAGEKGGSKAPLKFSSNLLKLKFMQKAQEKRKAQEQPDTPETKPDEVIVEGDPLPGALCGRMSFGSFNPATEKLQDDLNVRSTNAANGVNATGVSVTDEEMAAKLKKGVPQEFLPLRPSKKQRDA